MDAAATENAKRERRQRGEGRIWQIGRIWWIQYYVHGRQVRESSRSPTKSVALKRLKKRLAQAEDDSIVSPALQKLKYEQMRDALLADYRTNGRKSLLVAGDGTEQVCGLKHLNGTFKNFRAVDITTDRIREFISKRQAEDTPNSTINRSLALLRRMFLLAKQDKKLRDAPFVPMLKEPPARKGFLDYPGFQKLRQELPEHLRPVLTLGFYTGMRLGEIKKLRWSNVSLIDNQIRLDPGTTKNDESRVIPLIAELPDMLKILRQKNRVSEFVFTRNGKALVSFRKAWTRACVAAGLGRIEPVTDSATGEVILGKEKKPRMKYAGLIFHDLRRTGVRNLVRAGVPERVAMQISGHKTRAIFERYNIVSERDLKDAARKLDDYLISQNGANSGQVEEPVIAANRLTN